MTQKSFAGLFELSVKFEYVAKELVKYIDLTKDEVHAIIVVLYIKTRFSMEDKNILCTPHECGLYSWR